MNIPADVEVRRSNGRGKDGKTYYFIRPFAECFNRSRKVSGWTSQEINDKIEKVIAKWYSPRVILYQIEGTIIGSNSKENALKEWWRVCEIEKIKQLTEVELLNP